MDDKELEAYDARIEAMSSTHAELEKWHYRALKNPAYQIEGLTNALMENVSMSAESSSPVEEIHVTEKIITLQGKELGNLRRELIAYVDKKIKSMKGNFDVPF